MAAVMMGRALMPDYSRFPKSVIRANYTGNTTKLERDVVASLSDTTLSAVRALRQDADLSVKYDVNKYPGNVIEFYAKATTSVPFTQAEYDQLYALAQSIITQTITTLKSNGCTNIVAVWAGGVING